MKKRTNSAIDFNTGAPENLMSQGRIFIKSLEVFVRIGITAGERAKKQRLLIDVELEPETPFEELGDNIKLTVDYDRLCSQLAELAKKHVSNLIETLAVEVANHIKTQYPVQFVAITIYKFVLPNTKFVAVRYESSEPSQSSNRTVGLNQWLDD